MGISPATAKRLFAVSGNQCAFPKCKMPISGSPGTAVGEMCHIKANRRGGERYDPNQTDEERHAFENLILLCPTHHSVIDDDAETYTVERLIEMKEKHEARVKNEPQPTDEMTEQFLNSISNTVVNNGSIIFNTGQMGGQVAHSITNVGPQPRRVTNTAANYIVAQLRKLPSEQVSVVSIAGDSEAQYLANILLQILKETDWECQQYIGHIHSMKMFLGVTIVASSQRPAIVVLANWLAQMFPSITLEIDNRRNSVEIIVGANL